MGLSGHFDHIDHVLKLTLLKAHQIFLNDRNGFVHIAIVKPALVGGHDHIVHAPKDMVCWQRLLLKDVQCRRLDGLLVQGLDQVGLIDHAASCQIDQVAGLFHDREGLFIDDAMCLGCVGREQYQIVGLSNGSKRILPGVDLIKPGDGSHRGADANHAQPQGFAFGCEFGGNHTGAVNDHRLAMQESWGDFFLPLAVVLVFKNGPQAS